MKKATAAIAACVGLSLYVAATPASASLDIDVPANAYITIGGLDWAWAGPCDALGFGSCGPVDLSFQSTKGWRLPTISEFANRPDWDDFFFAGANVPGGGTGADGATFFGANGSDAACATPYFSDLYLHCDLSDGQNDVWWNPDGSTAECCHETLVVRENRSGAVPEPHAWALMLIGFGVTGSLLRRARRTYAMEA